MCGKIDGVPRVKLVIMVGHSRNFHSHAATVLGQGDPRFGFKNLVTVISKHNGLFYLGSFHLERLNTDVEQPILNCVTEIIKSIDQRIIIYFGASVNGIKC